MAADPVDDRTRYLEPMYANGEAVRYFRYDRQRRWRVSHAGVVKFLGVPEGRHFHHYLIRLLDTDFRPERCVSTVSIDRIHRQRGGRKGRK